MPDYAGIAKILWISKTKLPGTPGAPEPPGVNFHIEDESARVMVVKPDHVGVYRGSPGQIRLLATREAEAMGQTPADIGLMVTNILLAGGEPLPWQSVSLTEAANRHSAVKLLLFGAAAVGFAALVSITGTCFTRAMFVPDVTVMRAEAEAKARGLMQQAGRLGSNPLSAVLSDMMRLENALDVLGGTITQYADDDGRIHWKAIVPPSVSAASVGALGGKAVRMTDDGMEIERK